MADERKAYLERAGAVIAQTTQLLKAIADLQTAAARCAPGSVYPGFAAGLGKSVELALTSWQAGEPAVFGLGEPESQAERALREAEQSLKLAQQRLAWAKEVNRREDRPERWEIRVEGYERQVAGWQRRLRFLRGEPEPEREVTMDDLDRETDRLGSIDRALQALGLGPRPPKAPIPAIPR